MCDQTEINYLDGEVVWVKLSGCWWPGEVVASEKLPPDVLPSFRKPPIAVVKFFQEDTYEYVKNINSIYKYNCSRKNEFINKGLYMYRTKHGHMEKFPEDVIRAETAVGGDIEILTRDEFQETKKESYAGLFGEPSKRTPTPNKKGRISKGRFSEMSPIYTPPRKIKEKTDYKVHILVQGSKSTPSAASEQNSPSSMSRAESEPSEEKLPNENNEKKSEPISSAPSTPTVSSSGLYSCHACSFSTSRLNVLILHNKTHSVTFTPYTPSPVRKKPIIKSSNTTPTTSKTPKVRRPRSEKLKEKSTKKSKISQGKKRASEEQTSNDEVKKAKTDEEIKSSLLADWEDADEESNDESSNMIMAGSPELPATAESPAAPVPAELPEPLNVGEISLPTEKKSDDEKPESSSDSKYEFCEDEDWPVEADAGRKIPRVKNPKRKEDTKSLSLDEDEVAKEVAELLNKTTMPELPSAPEPLKVEENFPEPSIVKSPDKKSDKLLESTEKTSSDTQPTKAIFKTKTFFRSRHSRSQDAIGKYVAEQLNAVERMDTENEINGSDVVSSPEARESPPIEPVKVARLAPKIQLKKMKAEAAQLREKEKEKEHTDELQNILVDTLPKKSENKIEKINDKHKSDDKDKHSKLLQDVLYPPQEIKPINSDTTDKIKPLLNIGKNIESSYDEGSENLNKIDADELKSKDKAYLVDDGTNENEVQDPGIVNNPGPIVQPYEQPVEPYMSESTASAVDALLSVSREADRVTRIISNDPPEDLFEDDVKESGVTNNNVNGFNEIEDVNDEKELGQEHEHENKEHLHQDIINKEDSKQKNEFHLNEPSNTIEQHLPDGIVEGADINMPQIQEIVNDVPESIVDNIPSESDLQIAETLINLPSSAIKTTATASNDQQININLGLAIENEQLQEQMVHTSEEVAIDSEKIYESKDDKANDIDLLSDSLLIPNNDSRNVRFETEQEKSENLNAAQSLVQMSESIDHKINVIENNKTNNKEVSTPEAFNLKPNNGIDSVGSVEQKVALLSSENNSDSTNCKITNFETSSSKLLKILEEPCAPKVAVSKLTPAKHVIVPGKEKILNFDVAKSSFKGKPPSPKQKIIIRRTAPTKNIINNVSDITTPDKIILSRNKPVQEGSSVQTYTIKTSNETSTDANTIIIHQKIRKIAKAPTKLQKINPQTSLITPLTEAKIASDASNVDDAIFDINSMPIVLSEDLESIEKMPIVMTDGNFSTPTTNPPKLVKTKSINESEKICINAAAKPEVKTLLMNPVTEVSKTTTPNILSKSSKLRGAKPMLVIDKTTGKQKIIMTKAETTVKEIKPSTSLIQTVPQNAGKSEKFIILPTPTTPRPGRTQKIVIDPQTGKAHVLVAKGPDTSINAAENKPVSAKLVPPSSDTTTPGNTVMIITNAQGAQSRIVLTPEHEKILFPNKQQPNVSQLKTIAHRITSNSGTVQKTLVTTSAPVKPQTIAPAKTQTRIVPKQKSAIITSKGQLIVGGRVTTTSQNIAPMPEIRPVPKRIVASEPKKLVQTIQKTTNEPLIYLQQKSGAVMQLTAAQFEHLQRTGQIVQKVPAPVQENKIVQKSITMSPNEPAVCNTPKSRVRKTAMESPTLIKKMKQEIAIAPAPPPPPPPTPQALAPVTQMPALTPLTNTIINPVVPPIANAVTVTSSASYTDLENFEELLPSTAIARQPEPPVTQIEQQAAPPPAPLSDGQLLAVPGEHFGGPPGSFYLCVEDNGTLTPIDNRPLVLENNQLVPMAVEPLSVLTPQPERRDILEAALANSDVFHAETPRDDAPDFRDLNANVSVHCRVSETSTTLNQPIMTPVEMPSKVDSEPTVPSNLEDGLAVIGVTPHTVPTSLELPITVTDPRIALKTTDPLSNNNYGPALLPSPNTEMTFVTSEETEVAIGGPISMPLLTDEESVGKSMPILTDEVTERTVSSVESTVGSPSSTEVRESEAEDSIQWSRRLLTPGSDTSETSAEIPLQPLIQFSANELSRHA